MIRFWKFFVLLFCLISLSSLSCFADKINNYGLFFGSQNKFNGFIDYKFFSNLSTCTPYTTPVVINAPLGIPNGYYKSQITGLNGDKCVVKNFDKLNSKWVLTTEYQIPKAYAKGLGDLVMSEIKNPNLRLKHLTEYCNIQKRPTEACIYLKNGSDKNDYFFHVNLGLNKYKIHH